MRKIAYIVLLLCALPGRMLGNEPAKAQPVATTRQVSFAEFGQEIERLESAVADLKSDPKGVVALHDSIPEKYIVVGDNTSFTIDNTVLKKSIGEYAVAYPQRKSDLLNALHSAISEMRAGLAAYSQPASHAVEHNALAQVLARREFRRVSGPTKLEILADRVKLWLARLLMKLFGNIPSPAHGSDIMTWVLIGIATVLLALWLMRIGRSIDREQAVERILFAPSERHWSVWLSEAKTAAAGGNWRDAIHFAYWAGISKLEESGAWVPDRARTPREYLKMISTHDPNRSALSALTRKFEVVWYGEFPAESRDFQETLQQLEAIGCR